MINVWNNNFKAKKQSNSQIKYKFHFSTLSLFSPSSLPLPLIASSRRPQLKRGARQLSLQSEQQPKKPEQPQQPQREVTEEEESERRETAAKKLQRLYRKARFLRQIDKLGERTRVEEQGKRRRGERRRENRGICWNSFLL